MYGQAGRRWEVLCTMTDSNNEVALHVKDLLDAFAYENAFEYVKRLDDSMNIEGILDLLLTDQDADRRQVLVSGLLSNDDISYIVFELILSSELKSPIDFMSYYSSLMSRHTYESAVCALRADLMRLFDCEVSWKLVSQMLERYIELEEKKCQKKNENGDLEDLTINVSLEVDLVDLPATMFLM